MKFNVFETWAIICDNYGRTLEYDIGFDPDVTFQEFVLYQNMWFNNRHGIEFLDSEDFKLYEWEWDHGMVSHFFQPKVIDKPWDQVIVKRNWKKMTFVMNPPTERLRYEEGRPYLELWKKIDDAEQKKYEKAEARRQRAHEKQRERRARQKDQRKNKTTDK